jgi:hypothetical protein
MVSLSKFLHLSTDCLIENEFGSCPGERVCEAAGLSVCDATIPSPESCNDIDDDCDGEVDNIEATTCLVENEFGSCEGIVKCGLGEEICEGVAPAKEICDGLDNDCDGPIDEGSCDDDNLCTDDVCDPALGCQMPFNSDPCTDGNPCTENDHCAFGECAGSFLNCDDGNPCTTDSCDPQIGCTYTYVNGACDDGNPCTVDDSCNNGFCKGIASGCQCNSDIDCAQFEDNNPCNGTLVCNTQVAPYKCVVNPASIPECSLPAGKDPTCAQAACNQQNGLCEVVAYNNGSICNDNDLCTVNEICVGGECSGQAKDCSDSNSCTDDTCNPVAGCAHAYNVDPCDDGNLCTIGDVCQGGTCVGGNCTPGVGASCTYLDDACSVGTCKPKDGNPDGFDCEKQFKPEGTDCDDTFFCTIEETCDGAGFCGNSTPNPCSDVLDACNNSTCDEQADACSPSPKEDGISCNDGDACTIGDSCQSGICAGTSNVCGEYKVSTFHTSAPGYGPAIADHQDGRYGIFWNDSTHDKYYGRSYTDSWSKEWSEFESYAGGIDDAEVAAAGFADGKMVVAFTHRLKSSASSKTCYQYKYDNSCSDNNQCYYKNQYSSYYKAFTKYYGSKVLEERIVLRWFNSLNETTKTVTVFDRSNSFNHTYDCSTVDYVYTANFGKVKVAASPNGNTVILWQDNTAIKGRIYSAAGAQVKDLGTLGSNWSGFDVATHKDDAFIIVWSASGNLAGQLYTSDGTKDGSQISVSSTSGTQENPAVDTYYNGRFVVAWESNEDGDKEIMTRMFKKDGAPVSPAEVKVNTSDNGSETLPDVAAFDLAGNFMVVWQGTDPNGSGILGQFYNKNASPIGVEKIINVETTGAQTMPAVLVLSNADGIVSWRGPSGQIWARKYDSAGEALTDSKEIVLNSTVELEQASPDAAKQADVGYVTTWESSDADNDVDIKARLFDTDGLEYLGNIYYSSNQDSPTTVALDDGKYVNIWRSNGQDGGAGGIIGRVLP